MTVEAKQWLMWISEIQALAQSGLTYTENPFDRGRYKRLTELTAEMAAEVTLTPLELVKPLFTLPQKSYATPILDVRSFVLKDDKILMVKERVDGKWTLPGGFADVNESPSVSVIRETVEESGFIVEPIKLLAMWDTLKHESTLRWPHIYKCAFHCQLMSGEPRINLEIDDIDFFSITDLPPISAPRITLNQLHLLYDLVRYPQPTVFD